MRNSRDYISKSAREAFNLGFLALLAISTYTLFHICVREVINYFYKQETAFVREDSNRRALETMPSQLEKSIDGEQVKF